MSKRLFAAVVVIAGAVGVFHAASCGGVAEEHTPRDASTDRAADTAKDPEFPFEDATIGQPDGPDFSHPRPDGGPPAPVVACGDGSVACALPPSVCLDHYWLRSYGSGVCADGGCTFTVQDLECTNGWWCEQGGCRYPIVR